MSDIIIGVDLGGTQIRTARFDRHLNILERQNTLTLAHEGPDATIDRIIQYIRMVMPEDISLVSSIGVSAPGPLNPQTGVVVAPPNLDGWHNVPLGNILSDTFGIPTFIGNDANVSALAEVARGAAKGYRHAIYITVSTGIGSGMVVDGRLLLGQSGLAAEVGHIIMIVEEGRVSSLEEEAAGPAIAEQICLRIEQGDETLVKMLANGDLTRIDARMVGQAAAQGDALALEIVSRAGRIVGLGIVNLLHLFNPEIVVIGGGVSKMGDLLLDPMRRAIEAHVIDAAYTSELKIVRAALGDDVALVGAGALAITQGGQADVTEVVAALGEG